MVYIARALRDFGDEFVVLLLPFYLAARGFDAFEIDIVATSGSMRSALTGPATAAQTECNHCASAC
jgi:hypothetical protein